MEKLRVSRAVRLEGELTYDKVLEFYNSCDLIVFPSYIESYPLPLLEAAMFGLPVLASDCDIMREVIAGYNGIQFLDYQDYKQWGEKIIECYNLKPKFKPFISQFATSWKGLFDLIDDLLK